MEKNNGKSQGLFGRLSSFFKREKPSSSSVQQSSTSHAASEPQKEPQAPNSAEAVATSSPAELAAPIALEPTATEETAKELLDVQPVDESSSDAEVIMPPAAENKTQPAAGRSIAKLPEMPFQAPDPRPLISTLDLSNFSDKKRLHISDLTREEAVQLLSTFVQEHMSDELLSVETMAAQLKVSRTGLYQLVHEIFGKTPANYIMDCRLQYACKLLAEGRKVREVSMKCGFSDPKYFSKVFKKAFNVLPSNFVAS